MNGIATGLADRTRRNDDLICALLRDESAGWPGADAAGEADEFLSRAEYHGVLPLLDDRFRRAVIAGLWPEAIRQRCRADALSWVAWDLAHRHQVARLLARLRDSGVTPLVLKGGALAYTLYQHPGLRPRGDIDILIARADKGRSEKALCDLGYARHGVSMGEAIAQESTWNLVDHLGASHDVDLHWRANNSPRLAKLLGYEEMTADAIGVPELGPDAFTPRPVHALLFACIHRAGHAHAPIFMNGVRHSAKERLIWLYDIHLLASRMTTAELEEIVALALQKRMTGIVLEALAQCEVCFRFEFPPGMASELSRSNANEPSARFLGGGRMRQMAGDLLALDGVGTRLRWLREFAFPSAEYMRKKYPEAIPTWLLLLYARRAFEGVFKLWGRDAEDSKQE